MHQYLNLVHRQWWGNKRAPCQQPFRWCWGKYYFTGTALSSRFARNRSFPHPKWD